MNVAQPSALPRLTTGLRVLALIALATLAVQGLLIQPARAAAVTITAAIPSFDSSNIQAFQRNGSAALAGNRLRLTDAVGGQAASAFWKNRANLANNRSFSSYFSFEISNSGNGGADGITFAIQTVSNSAGSQGGGIGIAGISPSVAIEFDTWQNGEYGDPNSNHIGLDLNGNIRSTVTADAPGNLESGIWHVWVDYNGGAQNLQVRMNTSGSRPASPVLNTNVNLASTLTSPDVYLGFTSATGGAWARHEILGFYFNNDFLPSGITPGGADSYTMAPTNMTVSASPISVPQNTASTITITATGPTGAAAANQQITLSSNIGTFPGGNTVTTNPSGVATATFQSANSGTATIRATAPGGVFGTATVTIQTATLTKITSSPISLHLGNTLLTQVDYNGVGQIYSPNSKPANYGTSLAVGGTLYGFLGTAFSPVNLSGVTGAGTVADPFVVTSLVNVGATGLQLEQKDFVVNGQEAYRTELRVINPTGGAQNVVLYRSMDCFLGGSDVGYSTLMDASIGSVACTKNAGNNPPNLVEQLYPLQAARYIAGHYSRAAYAGVQSRGDLANTVSTAYEDNGQAIGWSLSVPANGSVTRSHLTNFSPSGRLALQLKLTPSATSVAKGGTLSYELSLENPFIDNLTVNSLSVTLPAGFSYVAGSSTGLTTSDPTVSGQVLTWSFAAQAMSGIRTLRFNVTASNTAGRFGASAAATTSTAYSIAGVTNGATVTIVPSSNNRLSGLAVSNGVELSPAFNTDITAYSASVANSVSRITITPTATDSTTQILVNGRPVTSGSPAQIDLEIGSNTIQIRTVAENGDARETTITITRASLSAVADLASLSVVNGATNGAIDLSPAFSTATTRYTASVGNEVTTAKVTAAVADANATVFINGAAVASGSASGAISLNAGENTINVVVRAQNLSERTYYLTITRARSANNNLGSLTPSSGSLSPAFDPGVTTYEVSVANNVTSFSLTPQVADPTARVNVSPATLTDMAIGPNPITVVVTAQDGTLKSYNVIVNRAPSSVAALSALTLSNATLDGFDQAVTNYTLQVANGVTETTVTPTAADANATITIKGVEVDSGQPSELFELQVGPNQITIVVTAQDGITTTTYTITIIRAGDSNAALINMSADNGALTPVFSPGTTDYTIEVPGTVEQFTVTPTTAAEEAFVEVNGQLITSGEPSFPVNLEVGENKIDVKVTAQDGTINTYTITVIRATPYIDADLNMLNEFSGWEVVALKNITFTLAVENLGPDTVEGAQIDAVLPVPAAGKSWAWTCTATGGAVCLRESGTGNLNEVLGAMPADSRLTFVVAGELQSWGYWRTTAILTGPENLRDTEPVGNAIYAELFSSLLPQVYKQ